MKSSLSILSWNIQSRDGVNGNKLDDKEFVKQISNYDIFCLQECRKNIKLPNFICYNRQRPHTSGGGVCIGFSRRLTGGIKQYDTGEKVDLLAVVLDQHFFNLKKDILLITCYIPPSNSSYTKNRAIDPFDDWTSVLVNAGNKYDIVLCGDFNSRTQSAQEHLLCDKIPGLLNEDIDDNLNRPASLTNTRNNKDSKTNMHTGPFLDLVT